MWMSKLVFWGEGTLASYVKFSMRREGTIACELSLVWPVFYKKGAKAKVLPPEPPQ